MNVNNPNIVIRQPQYQAYRMFATDYLDDQIAQRKQELYDRLELVKMGLELHKVEIEWKLENLDNAISELKDMLKDV